MVLLAQSATTTTTKMLPQWPPQPPPPPPPTHFQTREIAMRSIAREGEVKSLFSSSPPSTTKRKDFDKLKGLTNKGN